jgi:hypothetical protein
MSIKEFEKERKAIWSECQKELGWSLPMPFREAIEQMVHLNPRDEETLDDLNGLLADIVPALEYIPMSNKTNKDSAEAKPKRRYKKCYERRVLLFAFVTKWNRPFHRINWKQTVAEWNKAHPSDIMSVPVMKAEYYHALRNDPPISFMNLLVRLNHVLTEFKGVLLHVASGSYSNRPDILKMLQEFELDSWRATMGLIDMLDEMWPSWKVTHPEMYKKWQSMRQVYDRLSKELNAQYQTSEVTNER